MASSAAPRVAFVSCNETPWGGSEELWAHAALALAEGGATIAVAKPRIDKSVPPIVALRAAGATFTDLARLWPLPGRLAAFLNFLVRPALLAWQLVLLWLFLRRAKPDLVVLSQGGCWDGFYMGYVLDRLRLPYVLICQKASDLYWPPDHLRAKVRAFACRARHVYFVSQHNRALLEQQIAVSLQSTSVVRNPFLVDYDTPLPWPDDEGTTRLACVGRLYPMEKGQDILLRVLARPKWRERDVAVDFYGAGINRDGLSEMAEFIECSAVRFCGHVADVREIWRTHHALVLPSRAEGLPLVLVETMLAGRVAVVSTAGGSAEVVDDGRTAFLMRGFDEDGLDEAMERAWLARSSWREIGAAAASAIKAHVPSDPAGALARDILSRLEEVRGDAEGAR